MRWLHLSETSRNKFGSGLYRRELEEPTRLRESPFIIHDPDEPGVPLARAWPEIMHIIGTRQFHNDLIPCGSARIAD